MCIAAAIAGAAVVGAGATIYSAKQAGDAADEAGQNQLTQVGESRRQYDQSRADLAPWREAGTNALRELQNPVNFHKDPGYDFAYNEGQRALERRQVASGNSLGGGALKALERYGQGMADQQFGSYINRQQSLAGIGQSATNTTAQLGQNALSQQGQAYANAGQFGTSAADARASGYLGAANTLTGAANSYLNWNALKGQSPVMGGGSGGYNLGSTSSGAFGQPVPQVPQYNWGK